MDLVKTCYILASLIFLAANIASANQESNLSYSSADSYSDIVYEDGSAYSEVIFVNRFEYNNCTISTANTSLPTNWETSEPNFLNLDTTGNHSLNTPKITPDNYPANGSVDFTLKCTHPNLTTSLTSSLNFNFEKDPGLIGSYSLDKKIYLGLILTILILISIFLVQKTDFFTKRKTERLSQKVIEDLKRRDYTSPEIERKISKAQRKIDEEKYEEAISLLRDADQKLERT